MMNRTNIALMLVFLLTPVFAAAQVAEIGGFGGIHRVGGNPIGNLSGTEYRLDDGWMMGGRLTLNTFEHFGHEIEYSYNRTSLEYGDFASGALAKDGTAIHRFGYNFLAYATPEGSAIRPFAGGGGHFSTHAYPGYSGTQGGSTKVGYNFGGGVKIRVTPMYGIRFDVHNYRNPKPYGIGGADGWLNHMCFSAGFTLLL